MLSWRRLAPVFMRIGFLIGDLPSLQPTFAGVHLAWSAHRRGHEVCFVTADGLSFLDDGSVFASTLRVRAGDYAKPSDFHRALMSSDAVREDDMLSGFDVVFIRYNPLREPHGAPPSPILDFCWRLRLDGTFVINDPEGVFRAWGRLYLADLPADVHARTLVSRSPAKIKAFLRDLDRDAVLKSLAHAGHEKVFRLHREKPRNLNPIITAITRDGYAVAQEYLREAEEGEKRVLLLGGEPIRIDGQVAIYRRHPGLAESGKKHKSLARRRCTFGASEERICELLRPKLLADGLYFVSVDLAGGKILELNAFSPGGIHSLREIYRMDAAQAIICDLERRVRLRAAYRGTHDPEAAGVV
jgi:glutathione synthase